MDARLFDQILAADVAIEQGVLSPHAAAEALGRFCDDREQTILGSLPPTVRAGIETAVRRAAAEAGDDVRAAIAQRQVHRHLAPELQAFATLALDADGARLLAPLREVERDRYVGFLPLGEGGMGVVYLTLDSDLNRRVAFKMIRPDVRGSGAKMATTDPLDAPSGHIPEDIIARFLQEAVVTGGLEHPGIVPVYELGRTPAGAPYYTMRLVRGETTLEDAISEARTLEARLGLLEPFLKVCDAMRYAHSRGVIHRDLKPGNVALGAFGEVVVLDWGLAKMRSRPDLAQSRWQSRLEELRGEVDLRTLTSSLGTPGYMAPEAFLGAAEAVDARSDIYSLGAMLYRILTGRLPFQFASFNEFVEKLRGGVVDPFDAPGGLAAICRRALAHDPKERYADVGELGTALRAWQAETAIDREIEGLLGEASAALAAAEGLAGEPLLRQLDRAIALGARVHVLRPGHEAATALRDRARTLRAEAIAEGEGRARRRILKRVAIGGLLVATIATVVVALLLDAKRREAVVARAQEADQRARAEDLANFMLYDLRRGLEPVGRLDLLRAVAEKSAAYYEHLSLTNATAEVLRARARALSNIGEVFLATGDLADAEAKFGASRTTLEDVVRKHPDNEEALSDLAAALNRVGDVQQDREDLPAALRSYEASTALRRRLLARHPADGDRAFDLSRSLDRVGDAYARMGKRDVAAGAYGECLDIRRDLATRDPDQLEWQRALSMSLCTRGEGEVEVLGVDAARATFEESLAILERLLAAEPDSTERRYDVAGGTFRIAYVVEQAGDLAGALDRYRAALEIYRALVGRDASQAAWQRGVALTLERIAGILEGQGGHGAAIRHYHEAAEIKRRLVERDVTNARARHDLVVALGIVGTLAQAEGDSEGARSALEEALALAQALVADDPTSMEWQADLASAHLALGRLRRASADLPAARRSFGESLAIHRRLAAADPEHGEWQRQVAAGLEQLADADREDGDTAAALAQSLAALDIRQRLADRDASDDRTQLELAVAHNTAGALLRDAGEPAGAWTQFEAAAAVHRRRAALDPTDGARQRELAFSLYHAGLQLEALHRPRDALRLLREAAGLHRRAVDLAPERYASEHGFWSEAHERLVLLGGESAPETPDDHLALGYALHARHRFAEAAAAFEVALRSEALAGDTARGHLYNAACAAARVEGADASRWHAQAITWLGRDLRARRDLLVAATDALEEAVDPGPKQGWTRTRDALLAHLEHARRGDPDLASLRARPDFEALFPE
jgi:tetratricopeptide (TPR) repeat protein/tRNA A-37 threonylcarbamoyl transferase component Bud32